MTESTLAYSKSDIDAAIAQQLGYDPMGPMTGARGQQIDRVRKSGLNAFYKALLPNPEQQGAYEWSFTSPPATLALVAGTSDYDLPDDFAWVGSIGPRLVYPVGSGFVSAEKVDSHSLLEARAREKTGELTLGINAIQTTLVVSSADGFPTVAPFTIQIDSEQLRVTAITNATTFTVTRAYQSTTAVTHDAAAAVFLHGSPKRFAIRPRLSASTLNGAINSAVTSLVVALAHPFPTTVPFTILIDSEQIRVTAVSSTTFTVTRGYNSTTAASHASGAVVELVGTGQRFEMLVFPTPDVSRTINYRYALQLNDLTDALPYPLGGGVHGETIMLACLSRAELLINNEPGPLTAEFKQQLGASIVMDRRAKADQSEQFPISPPVFGSYGWLAVEVGRYMEIGANPSLWTWSEQEAVRSAINRGVNGVLNPDRTGDPRHRGHRWSFMSSFQTLSTSAPYSNGTVTIADGVVTLTGGTWPNWAAQGTLSIAGVMHFVASRTSDTVLVLEDTSVDADAGTTYSLGRERYTLPSNLSALDPGGFTFQPGVGFPPIKQIHADRMNELRQTGYVSAYPWAVSLVTATPDVSAVTSRYLRFWPVPNAVYTLSYRAMSETPNVDTGDFPPGGSSLGTLYLAAAIAAHDPSQQKAYLEALAGNIDTDQEQFQSAPLGENRDDSDHMGRHYGNWNWDHRYSTGTVFGQAYGSP